MMLPPRYLRRPGLPVAMESPPEDVGDVLRGLVLRPYIDLEPGQTRGPAPIHLAGLELARDRLLGGDGYDRLTCQFLPPANFRDVVLHDFGLDSLRVTEPAQLRPPCRSPSWELLTARVSEFERLPAAMKTLVLYLLCRLSLFGAALRLARPMLSDERASHHDAMPSMLAGAAMQRLGLAAESRALHESIAHGAAEPKIRLSATIMLLVSCAKAKPPRLQEARSWARMAEAGYAEVGRSGDDWRSLATLSWYWRGLSFLPFLDGDTALTQTMLDRAERLSSSIPADEPSARMARLESLHPLLETRAKAALLSGAPDAAVAYARRLVALDPCDPKVHVQLGHLLLRKDDLDGAAEEYARAVALGAPWRAPASFFLGAVHEASGDLDRARRAYAFALALDPNAISPAQRLRAIAPDHLHAEQRGPSTDVSLV